MQRLIVPLFTLILTASAELPAFKCEMQGDVCVFFSVKLNETHFRFYPRADRPAEVRKIRFFHTEVPIFGADICNAFPNLEQLQIYYSQTVHIEEDAFDSCTKLEALDMRYHSIETLKPKTFAKTRNLQFMRFDNGLLNELPQGIFENLHNLVILSLANNKLNRFPASLVKGLQNLTELWIYSNEIADIDERAMVRFLPKLHKIYINDNDLRCDRVEAITSTFENHGVTGFTSLTLRHRAFKPRVIKDIECLTTDQWNLINNEKGWKFEGESVLDANVLLDNLNMTLNEAEVNMLCSRFCEAPKG